MKKLAVFGNPVAHSRSPEIHEAFAAQTGVSLTYEKLLAPNDGFEAAVRTFIDEGGDGFNVTVPFKQQAWALMDECSHAANLSEAVNTVTVGEDGRLAGANTDGIGLVKDVEANLGWGLAGKRILVLGAGGAVRGVLPALRQANPASVHVLNRTHARAVELESRFDVAAVTEKTADDAYDVIINGSSAGLAGADVNLPARLIGTATACYDMVYGQRTAFIGWAERCGCTRTSDGLGMLVEQAAAAFEIWFGHNPDTRPVIAAMRIT